MKENGLPTYLNEDKESLLIASGDVEGVHGLPFECHGVANQLQKFVNAVKSLCGDNNIL